MNTKLSNRITTFVTTRCLIREESKYRMIVKGKKTNKNEKEVKLCNFKEIPLMLHK